MNRARKDKMIKADPVDSNQNQMSTRVSPRGTTTYRCPRTTDLAMPIPEGKLRCTDTAVPLKYIAVMERLMDTATGQCLRRGCGASKVLTPRSCKNCRLCKAGPKLIGKDMERRYYVAGSHMTTCRECFMCSRHATPVPHPDPKEKHGFLVGTDESFDKPCCGTGCYQTIMNTLAAEGISFGDPRTKLSISQTYVKKCEVCRLHPRRVEFDLAMVEVDGVPYPHPVVYGFTKRVCGVECALRDTAFPFPEDDRVYSSVQEYHDAHSNYRSGPKVTKSASLDGGPAIDWKIRGFRAQYRYYLSRLATQPHETKYYPLVDYAGVFLYRHLMFDPPVENLLYRLPKSEDLTGPSTSMEI